MLQMAVNLDLSSQLANYLGHHELLFAQYFKRHNVFGFSLSRQVNMTIPEYI